MADLAGAQPAPHIPTGLAWLCSPCLRPKVPKTQSRKTTLGAKHAKATHNHTKNVPFRTFSADLAVEAGVTYLVASRVGWETNFAPGRRENPWNTTNPNLPGSSQVGLLDLSLSLV